MSDIKQAAIAELRRRRMAAEAKAELAKRQGNGRTVIATTDDGGQVFRSKDGSLAYATSGYATTDQGKITEILRGATPAQTMQNGIDQERIAQNPIAARGAKFIQGVPFVGEYADEAVGAVSPQAGENMRATNEAMDRQKPGQSAALQVAGGVVGSIPLIATGAGVVAKGGGLVQKSAIGAGLGALGGATEGAISGYGRGEDAQSRADEAQKGATFGGVAGGVLGLAAPVLASGFKSRLRRAKRLDVSIIAEEFGIDKKTAGVVKHFLVNDDLDAAAKRLAEIGDDAMLADAGLGTGQALDTAMSSGGKALRIGRDAVEARATSAGKRLTGVLDQTLGEAGGIKAAAKGISARTAKARQAAYDAAFSKPIDYASAAGRKIEGVLARIPGDTMSRAVKEANEAMQEAGIANRQIMAQIADDGSVRFIQMPDVRQLDELKKALGQIAQSETDEFGRKISGAGIRAGRLAGDLKAAVGEAVPAYNTAVKIGGDKIAEDNALRLGRSLLTKATKLEDVQSAMKGASQEAVIAAKRGLREGIEDTLSNVRRTITDPNVDAREAMNLVKEMSSRANRAKLRAILGKDAGDKLLSELDRTAAALELRSVVATNSKTAVRQAGQNAVESATGAGPIGEVMRGKPIDAAQKLLQELTGATDAATVAKRDEIFGQIAEALTGKRGADARRALVAVKRAMDGQPIKDEDVARIVKEAGVPLLSVIHQSGLQSLESWSQPTPRPR